jgi:hypothetical protein
MRLIKAFHRHDWTPPRQMAALRIVCDYDAAFRRVEWCFTAAIARTGVKVADGSMRRLDEGAWIAS